jgi:hypothetical protein
LFVDCVPPVARDQVYPAVEAVQDILGAENDSRGAEAEAGKLLDTIRRTQPGLWDLTRPGLEDWQAFHRQRVRDQRAAFAAWFHQWQALRLLDAITAPANSAAARAGASVAAGQ